MSIPKALFFINRYVVVAMLCFNGIGVCTSSYYRLVLILVQPPPKRICQLGYVRTYFITHLTDFVYSFVFSICGGWSSPLPCRRRPSNVIDF